MTFAKSPLKFSAAQTCKVTPATAIYGLNNTLAVSDMCKYLLKGFSKRNSKLLIEETGENIDGNQITGNFQWPY